LYQVLWLFIPGEARVEMQAMAAMGGEGVEYKGRKRPEKAGKM
jgi:hypothetical protein